MVFGDNPFFNIAATSPFSTPIIHVRNGAVSYIGIDPVIQSALPIFDCAGSNRFTFTGSQTLKPPDHRLTYLAVENRNTTGKLSPLNLPTPRGCGLPKKFTSSAPASCYRRSFQKPCHSAVGRR